MNDAGTSFLGPITPANAATLQNRQCTLNAFGSSATLVGTTLTVNVSLSFNPAFSGAKPVFVFAYTATSNTGFQAGGTWTVPAGAVPTAGPLNPASGAGASQVFSAASRSDRQVSKFLKGWADPRGIGAVCQRALECLPGMKYGHEAVCTAKGPTAR
jgi:hypothetical protein